MKNSRFEYIIPSVLALVITIVLILVVPILTTQYRLELIDKKIMPVDDYKYFYDLDGDGSTEFLTIYYNASGNLSVSISTVDSIVINQFNLPGTLLRLGKTLDILDINSDGVKDIFLCSVKNDSLFLSIIDDIFSHPTTLREFFIEEVNRLNDNGDYLYASGGLSDINNDGTPEYIFAINGGHSLQPRRAYAVDYVNDTVQRSPLSGAAIIGVQLFDLDGDGSDEILLNTTAPENFRTSIPYSDSVAWLMVLDQDLNFHQPPVNMGPPPSQVSIQPFIHEGARYLMVLHKSRGLSIQASVLTIFDETLNPVRSRSFPHSKGKITAFWKKPGGNELSDIKIIEGVSIITIDFDLQMVDKVTNEFHFNGDLQTSADFDNDGEDELVMISGNEINVLRQDLQTGASLTIEYEPRIPRTLLYVIQSPGEIPLIGVQIGTDLFFLRYFKNNWVKYREFVYPSIFIILFGLFYLLVIVQNMILSNRYEKDRLISQLQLQSIKNQLDPHFTYNALNAVGSLIYKGEKDQAYQYLKGLTDLLRMVSGDSADMTWTLSQELEFVLKYLEIEKLRFREKFNYKLKVEEDRLKMLSVPKMSILTFVENAIKHGLKNKEYDRQLKVDATSFQKGVKITIRDNGIGRAAAARHGEGSAGHGLKMMKQYFQQFSEATGKKARFRVEDLFEYDLKAAGTLVEITII